MFLQFDFLNKCDDEVDLCYHYSRCGAFAMANAAVP